MYDFLERQVKDQMRVALGAPLQNISSCVLNKMVTRDVQANMRKYKMGVGRTPSRRSGKSNGHQTDGEDELSPKVTFEGDKRGRSMGRRADDDGAGPSRVIRNYIKDLDKGLGDKMSLLKMLVIKCDEADQNFNRLRSAINFGEMDSADR